MISINFGGVVNGTRAFLPILLAQNSGVIVNTSSVFGLLGMPYQSAYCASKFAVRGFTDSLRQELRGTGVRAATVHPGGVKTNIVRNARFHPHPLSPDTTQDQAAAMFDAFARTTPERAAEIIHDGCKAGKSRILVGPDAYAFDALARLMPSRYFDVLSRARDDVHAARERITSRSRCRPCRPCGGRGRCRRTCRSPARASRSGPWCRRRMSASHRPRRRWCPSGSSGCGPAGDLLVNAILTVPAFAVSVFLV